MTNTTNPVAAIDLGSNSFRLLIGLQARNKLRVLARMRIPVRLASGLNKTNTLTSEKINSALTAICSFRREMDRFAVNSVRCCGTEALRRAANRLSLIEPAEMMLGAPIEVLSGQEEAELTSLGARVALTDKVSIPFLIADVGGGSCELILHNTSEGYARIVSLPIGAVVLTEMAPTARELALRDFHGQIRDFLRNAGGVDPQTLVGTGGTASTLAMLAQQLSVYDPSGITGVFLSRSRINEICQLLAVHPATQRQVLPGLENDRADIIDSGLEIYQEIIATIGAPGMIVSDAGLLEGILHSITG